MGFRSLSRIRGVLTNVLPNLRLTTISFRTLSRIRGELTDDESPFDRDDVEFPSPLEDFGGSNVLYRFFAEEE